MTSKELCALTRALIKQPTVIERPRALRQSAQFISDFFPASFSKKIFVRNKVPTVLITTRPTLHPAVLLQGHFDVASGVKNGFKPRCVGDRIIGRGAVDMKGSVAMMMLLARELAAERPDLDFGLLLSGDEESGGKDGAGYAVACGVRTKLLINFDGGYEEAIINAEKGIMRLTLEVDGDPHEIHRQWRGRNAIDELVSAYARFQKLFPHHARAREGKNWYTTYTAKTIRVKADKSRLPHHAEMDISLYFTENRSVAEELAWIRKRLPGVTVKFEIGAERVYRSPSDPWICRFQRVASRVFGKTIPIRQDDGSSDARFFARHNIPIIILRPKGGDAEGPREWVSVGSLLKLGEATRQFLIKSFPL